MGSDNIAQTAMQQPLRNVTLERRQLQDYQLRMFKDFSGVWTPVLLRQHLRRKPVAVQIAGESVVLFRDGEGRAAALRDRCPHRGVKLSLGARTSQGHLACPFHGWEFDGHGACQHIPFNPEAKCGRASAMAFPVVEAGGMVWLHTAQQAADAPYIPKGLARAGTRIFHSEVTWKAHWTRVMENMIDSAHVPFVHQRTIGWLLRRNLQRNSTLDVSCERTDTGLFITGTQDRTHSVGVHAFNRPNGMVLYLDGAGGKLQVYIYCIPVHDQATRLLVVGDFGWRNPLAQMFAPLNSFVVYEDRQIVESSQPIEVPPPGVECAVASDRGTLGFRKYYYDVLKQKAAGSPALKLA